MEDKKFSITVPSVAKNVRRVSSEIIKKLDPYQIHGDKLFEIKLCVEEAVRNAMVHGNSSDAGRQVRVTYSTDGATIEIEVVDEGKGYDYSTIPDPTVDANLMKPSGRGIYLIKRLMDKVEFNKEGNAIKMTKRLK